VDEYKIKSAREPPLWMAAGLLMIAGQVTQM
jgi:hypothetical protein